MEFGSRDDHFDVLVVGAGVVGLSVALHLAHPRLRVGLLERHSGAGRETSSRNSGVIHAGIYYPSDSLKAHLCVEGRERLYHWCRTRDVPHQQCGKWIVATSQTQLGPLRQLMERGQKNGAGALQWVQQAEFRRREPDLNALAAVWSPESGVVDAEAFVQTLRLQAERAEVAIGWCTELVDLSQDSQGWSLRLRGADGDESSLRASVVVNAAGLHADALASRAGYDIDDLGWRQRLVRGDYYSLQGSTPRPRCSLVYPVPGPGLEGLGVHLTRDLGGRWLAGPDTTDIDEIDYRVGSNKAEAFAASLRAWLPEISASELRADYAGIRPRLVGPANASRDFLISLESEGFLHLGGIESPGLTASLAIGAHAAQMVEASGLMA